MEITVRRAAGMRKGTFWRPVEHSVAQRQTIEVRQRKGDDTNQPNLVAHRGANIELDALDLLLAGSRQSYTDARIEDPYKKGRFMEGFVYVRALAAFVYKTEVERVENMAGQIGPGAIISKDVRIEPLATIGAYAELESGVHVKVGATIGDNAVVRKGSFVNQGVEVGARSYIGQFTQVNPGAKIGPMSMLDRGVHIANGAAVGTQGAIGQKGYIGTNAWLDDSVHVGRHSFVGADAGVGEMTIVGDYSHIGNGSFVGAESRLGDLVRVAPGIMLVSPTYADNGTFIRESNLGAIRPDS
ncbi:MAG: DapH/DapD/GlmU-related protein [Candidatus Saccharimonadales bacterium]